MSRPTPLRNGPHSNCARPSPLIRFRGHRGSEAYVERVIGFTRRECLDHIIVFGEASLYQHGQEILS